MSPAEEAAFNSIYDLLHKEISSYCDCKCDLCKISSEEDRKFRVKHEVGTMAFVNGGEDYGKHVTIVDIVDKNNVVVEGDDFPKILFPNEMLAKSKLQLPVS